MRWSSHQWDPPFDRVDSPRMLRLLGALRIETDHGGIEIGWSGRLHSEPLIVMLIAAVYLGGDCPTLSGNKA